MKKIGELPGKIARSSVRALARLYYPTIVFSHRDRLPATGPVLLVANHPNSMMDPVILGLTAQRTVHFLAKAPLFDLPVLGSIMTAFGMVPAFRGVDDPRQITRNLKSMDAAAEYLAAGEAVGLFPEGKSHDSPKVDLIRSGAARIALRACQLGAPDLVIVPLGLNYQRKEQFRSSIWVCVGEPIPVGQWVKERGAEERRLLRLITNEIGARLRAVVVHLPEAEWERHLNSLELLAPAKVSTAQDPVAAIRQRKKIADAINDCVTTDRAQADALSRRLDQHAANLQAAGLDFSSAPIRYRSLRLALHLAWESLVMSAWFIPALLGTLHHLVPFTLVRGAARKLQTPGRSTISLARLGLGLPVYGLWYALVWKILADYFQPWIAWVWTAVMPLAGLLALQFWRRMRVDCRAWIDEIKMLCQRPKLNRLRAERQELSAALQSLTDHCQPAAWIAHDLPPPWKIPKRRTAAWVAVVVLALLAVSWVIVKVQEQPLPELRAGGPDLKRARAAYLRTGLDTDTKVLTHVLVELEELAERAQSLATEFQNGERTFYRQADNDRVRQLLLSFLSCRSELLRILWTYQNFSDIPDEHLKAETFLVALTSASVMFDIATRFTLRFEHWPEAVRKLNEPEPAWGIPAGLYDEMKRNLENPLHRQRLREATALYARLLPQFAAYGLREGHPYGEFHAAIDRTSRALQQTAADRNEFDKAIQEIRALGKEALYQGQTLASVWIGNTRIRRPRDGQPLIHAAELEQMRRALRPGDIVLERQNWYLSRAFMPGYWPHAAIYLGTTNDLCQIGLAQENQRYWLRLAEAGAKPGAALVIEAVPQGGVRLTTFEHCIGVADSAAALRPRLGEAEIRQAILRALSHLDKPYDFDFDFFSTDKIVCTELVYRAYDADIHFPLVEVMGRRTLPPTEIVRWHAREPSRSPFQFVAFLDGNEATGRSMPQAEPVFCTTIDRPALILFQEFSGSPRN